MSRTTPGQAQKHKKVSVFFEGVAGLWPATLSPQKKNTEERSANGINQTHHEQKPLSQNGYLSHHRFGAQLQGSGFLKKTNSMNRPPDREKKNEVGARERDRKRAKFWAEKSPAEGHPAEGGLAEGGLVESKLTSTPTPTQPEMEGGNKEQVCLKGGGRRGPEGWGPSLRVRVQV